MDRSFMLWLTWLATAQAWLAGSHSASHCHRLIFAPPRSSLNRSASRRAYGRADDREIARLQVVFPNEDSALRETRVVDEPLGLIFMTVEAGLMTNDQILPAARRLCSTGKWT